MFAVVVDFSEPIQNDNKEYQMKLKVIDETYNRTVPSFVASEEMSFVAHVHFFQKQPIRDNMPRVVSVGDIIRVRRFKFAVDNWGKVVGTEQTFSNWVVYDLQTLQHISAKPLKEKAKQRELSVWEDERLRSLQKWALQFLSQNPIKNII